MKTFIINGRTIHTSQDIKPNPVHEEQWFKDMVKKDYNDVNEKKIKVLNYKISCYKNILHNAERREKLKLSESQIISQIVACNSQISNLKSDILSDKTFSPYIEVV
jgi:hypothetical protein